MPNLSGLYNGAKIYKYVLQKRIGGGNFGDVWLANDKAIEQPLAIKIIDASQTSINQELVEAKIGNRMDQDNLVRVHSADVVKIDGKNAVIIAMDYLPKGSIASKTCTGNFVDIRTSIKAIIDILKGLEFLHGAGFCHNDIKPQNILIGSKDEALLADYGISAITNNGKGVKPKSQYLPYKAPETFTSQLINVKTDIYQAGLTLFSLVNGINLVSDTYKSICQPQYEDLVKKGKLLDKAGWQPFIPNSLKNIIKKATQCHTAKLFNSALEMRRALEKLPCPGAWTCLSTGEFQGDRDKYSYRFEIVSSNKRTFTAFKENKQSRRETKISAYCAKNIASRRELETAQSCFMKAVVEGKV